MGEAIDVILEPTDEMSITDNRRYAERLKALHDELLTAVLGPHWSGRSTSHACALERLRRAGPAEDACADALALLKAATAGQEVAPSSIIGMTMATLRRGIPKNE